MIGTDENRAVLHVEVIFWSGKRKTPPSLVSGKYCPHFVVIGTTEYLGVCFLDGTECTFDTPALGNAQPLYPDTIDYAPLENNVEFLIYEGANAVGKGRVLGRTIPYQVCLLYTSIPDPNSSARPISLNTFEIGGFLA